MGKREETAFASRAQKKIFSTDGAAGRGARTLSTGLNREKDQNVLREKVME